MVKREVLDSNFIKVGLHVPTEVLDICAEVCQRQKIDEASFVDTWVAFSMTVLNSCVPPTADKLIFFEKKEFGDPIFSTPKQPKTTNVLSKKGINIVSPVVTNATTKRRIDQVYESSHLTVNSPISQVFSPNNGNSNSQSPSTSGSVAGPSASPTPSTSGAGMPSGSSPGPSTPSTSGLSGSQNAGPPRASPSVRSSLLARILAPRPESPTFDLDPLELSSSLDFFTSGETVLTYGRTVDFEPSDFEPTINLFNGKLKKTWTSMIDILYDTWNIRQNFAEDIAKILLRNNNLPPPAPLDNLPVESSIYVGKVMQELGRIDTTDLVVEGLGKYSKDQVVLDISGIPNFSVFPGEVIAFRGVSRGDSRIIATNLYTNARGPIPCPPDIPDKFTIMIAAGPFSPLEYLDMTIIDALIEHAHKIRPAIVFLVGPFMDCQSPLLMDPKVDFYSNKKFKAHHNRLMNKISEAFAGLNTQVFYLTSSKDVNALPVFPTPIVNPDTGEYSHGVLPDPSLLNINGLIFGFTSADIMFYLSYQEFSNCKSTTNRISRIATHLLNQQSFYPLETGAFDESAIDYTRLYHHARIPVFPHILVLPSSLNHFIKDVDGCIIINPEKCVKGRRGNNFSLIEVRPQEGGDEWSTSTHVSVKIVRI